MIVAMLLIALAGGGGAAALFSAREDGEASDAFDVYPGDDLQAVIDLAATDLQRKLIRVHEGVYRPPRHRQAFIALIDRHDGIVLEAVGDVTLTAANPEVARKGDRGYPAIVNHVVYFGDGISSNTVLRGFKITGANDHVIMEEGPYSIQPEVAELPKALFFFADGGGIKIYGRAYPTIEFVELFDNYASPCAAAISIEHRGFGTEPVRIRNCVFRNNVCPINGAGIDILRGSNAVVENCLFVDNLSNNDHDETSKNVPAWKPVQGGGTLTVFPTSRVVVRNCTFTGNRNGVDDSGTQSVYENCIFWMNNAEGGWLKQPRYEMDIKDADGVRGCFLQGDVIDLFDTIDQTKNVFGCDNPQFDEAYRPQAPGFEEAGYRPVAKPNGAMHGT